MALFMHRLWRTVLGGKPLAFRAADASAASSIRPLTGPAVINMQRDLAQPRGSTRVLQRAL